MINRTLQIGIDRLVRLEWLEYTANLILAGNDDSVVKSELGQYRVPVFPTSPPTTRGVLSKTLTILMKTWLRVHRDLHPLRDRGLELLQAADRADRLAIHWGMIMAAYPFWGAVAGQTGRLLRLQENVTTHQIQLRIREQYGERQTVSRAAQRQVQSFVDWGVLVKENQNKGFYIQGHTHNIDDPGLVAWLMEATLHTNPNGSASIKDLLGSRNLFPFQLKHSSADYLVSLSPGLELLRHGLDDDLVLLKRG